MSPKERLSYLLTNYLRQEGLSGRELAKRLKVSSTSGLAYLDGVSMPQEGIRRRIADLLGLSFEELEHELFGITIAPEKTVDQVCREIRLMPKSDFLKVYRVVHDRALAELQADQLSQ